MKKELVFLMALTAVLTGRTAKNQSLIDLSKGTVSDPTAEPPSDNLSSDQKLTPQVISAISSIESERVDGEENNKPKKFFTPSGIPLPYNSIVLVPPSSSRSADPSQIVLDQLLKLEKEMSYNLPATIDKNTFHFIKFSGTGEVIVEVFTPDDLSHPIYGHQLILEDFLRPSLLPIGSDFLMEKGSVIRLSYENKPSVINALTFIISVKPAFEMAFNENMKIYVNFAKQVPVLVSNPTLHANATLSNRLQFIMQTSLDTQMVFGGETAELFINQDSRFPSSTDYQMKASGSLGTGLIKTLSPGRPYYCFQQECVYHVTISTSGLDYVTFFPTVFANDSVLKFQRYLYLIEEIEPHEKIEYELSVPKSEGSWAFSVLPTTGSVELFINPDFRPERTNDYKYMISSHRPEEIIITAQEAQEFGFSFQKFFITYRSNAEDKPVVFKFEARRYDPGVRMYIKPNAAEGGVAAKTEIIQYYLNLESSIPESITAMFKMISYSGHADLYVKECLAEDLSCRVTEEDVRSNGSEYQQPHNQLIFRSSANNILDSENPNKKDLITLNFNCGKTDPSHLFENHYPVSNSCHFAIGVHCRDSFNKYGAFYKLISYTSGIITDLKLDASTILKLNPEEKSYFKVDVTKMLGSESITALYVKVIAISGNADVYFSKTNYHPDPSDNEALINIRDNNLSTLRTQAHDALVNLNGHYGPESDSEEKYIYIGVESQTYSVLDLYLEFVGPTTYNDHEFIKESNVLHRKITQSRFWQNHTTGDKTYYTNFHFKIPQVGELTYYALPRINIGLNSQVNGLKICVQENTAEFDVTAPCTFESTTEHLSIDESKTRMDVGKTFIFLIQKIVKEDQKMTKFPIEFVLSLNSGVHVKDHELFSPGTSFTSVLNMNEAVSFTIDLSPMHRSAQVYFYSSDPNVQAHVSTGTNQSYSYLTSLDQGTVGFSIQDAIEFKSLHCSKNCRLNIGIYAHHNSPARFTILHVIDDSPILLKDGDQLMVANNIGTYFVYEADGSESVSFSSYSDKVLSVAYSKILQEVAFHNGREFTRELNEMDFDFKTNIQNAPRIVYPKETLEFSQTKLLGFFVEPKFNYRTPTVGTTDLIRQDDITTVHLHSRSQKLIPFILTDGQVNTGDMVYYHLTIDHPEDFSVILTLHSGSATMYISKNDDEFPTEHNHWKKTNRGKGDEITITQDLFEDPRKMTGIYVIGVRGNEKTHFSLLFMPEFKNLIKMKYQRLIDLQLTHDKNYYFDFFNAHEDYNTLLYAEDSDIEVSALNYDENKYQDFISMVTNESNYLQKFIFKKGELPRKRFFEHSATAGTHIIARVKALEADARVNFAIYDRNEPLLVPMDKRFTFVQTKGDKIAFVAKLDSKYGEVDLDVKLEFGSISVSYSDLKDSFDNLVRIQSPSQKYFQYKITNVQKSNDIMIFNHFYLTITADEFSKFSLVIKPKDKFKQLKAFEPEIIYTNPEKDTYVFYHLKQKLASSMKEFAIEFSSVHYFDQKPELLFVAESEIVLEEGSLFLPMSIRDLTAKDTAEFRHLHIKPVIQSGFYVLKIGKFPTAIPIKINVVLNDHRSVQMNGLYHGHIPANHVSSHSYSMVIPSGGEFRLVLESCSKMKIASAEFFGSHPILPDKSQEDSNVYSYHMDSSSTIIQFEDHFIQGYPLLFLNETQAGEDSEMKMLAYPVKRGFVKEHGVLKFNVVRNEEHHAGQAAAAPEEEYTLITEFRPDNRELILKDYVKIFDENEQASQKLFRHEFLQNNNSLKIEARVPTFRPQLLADYASLTSVKIKVYFYLLADPSIISKLEVCGQSMFKTIDHDLRIVEKEYSRSDIIALMSTSEFLDAEFPEAELSKYRTQSQWSVLSFVSVRFFEGEDDKFNVSLNFKYTNVPYFLMTIPFAPDSLISITAGVLMALIAVAVFFVVFYAKTWNSRQGPEPKNYSKAGETSYWQESTKLEMSTISSQDLN
jgi:hypothetical protein